MASHDVIVGVGEVPSRMALGDGDVEHRIRGSRVWCAREPVSEHLSCSAGTGRSAATLAPCFPPPFFPPPPFFSPLPFFSPPPLPRWCALPASGRRSPSDKAADRCPAKADLARSGVGPSRSNEVVTGAYREAAATAATPGAGSTGAGPAVLTDGGVASSGRNGTEAAGPNSGILTPSASAEGSTRAVTAPAIPVSTAAPATTPRRAGIRIGWPPASSPAAYGSKILRNLPSGGAAR